MVNLLVDPPIGVIVILENVSKKWNRIFMIYFFPRDSTRQQVEMSNTYFEQQCTI